MEQMRLLLAIVLSFLVFVVWQWLVVEPEMAKQVQDKGSQVESTSPTEGKEDTTAGSTAAPAVTPVPPMPIPTPPPANETRTARTIVVETPLYSVTLNEKGAVLDDFILKRYRETVDSDGPLKNMIDERARQINMDTSWIGNGIAGMENAVYALGTPADRLVLNEEKQTLDFQWVNHEGVSVLKQFVFSADSYLIELNVTIANLSTTGIGGQPAVKIGQVVGDPDSRITFEGPMALMDDKLEEIKVKDIADKPDISGSFRWIGITDRYFMKALIPEEIISATMKMEKIGDDLIISQLVLEETEIAPGEAKAFAFKAFIGPKDTEALKTANYELSEAVNFGMFDFLAKPFLWIMNQIYKVIPNYGIAIMILTLLTKIILFPLGNKSYKSMNDMKRMQPLMTEIREKYKDDKKKMNEETMALYRTYKINPMGGCLPMVVQLPVFFALYRMLYQAIELRHAPFFGWINDLSAPDRLFHFGFSIPFMQAPYGIPVLTVVMGATMFLQQKMSPPPGDPTQAKLMMFMPLIFTVIFINFPAGLVLYWLVNNVFSIAQQYYIQKKYA
ncbi:MAG: membrane protein insertase YidC [Deltaproteobacteria bacterium]|nr:membrane protein insertase YidC [Deltaproteobacteria bacterium]